MRISFVEQHVTINLPGYSFHGDWLMVMKLFARHTSPWSSIINGMIDAALATGASATMGEILNTEPSNSGAAIGNIQKEMQDLQY
jgi:hypothetical protein